MINITVYGLSKCDVCKRFIKRIEKTFGNKVKYEIIYVDKLDETRWRENKLFEIFAAVILFDDKYPIIKIDNMYYNYSLAMAELDSRLNKCVEEVVK